ncbi:fructose-6-phosphate aldolase [Microbacterium sediminicola]|uniref:Fructose-6-phosphate aldolase n=1 Tax=Microbacterium sediminicola TaxID=415210 RepID=A0ABN2I8D9_9MICO
MLYIDSADRERLAPLLRTGLFAGVTTNPLILSRAGLTSADLPELHAWLVSQGCTRFYAQATGATLSHVRENAAAVAALGADIVIKLMANREGFTVARELAAEGREVLITGVYHPSQMLLSHAAGAHEIAPYVGRASEHGRDGLDLVAQMARMSAHSDVRILAASIRSVDQIAQLAAVGADDLTISTDLAEQLFDDALTGAAAADFETIANAMTVSA